MLQKLRDEEIKREGKDRRNRRSTVSTLWDNIVLESRYFEHLITA